jgi:hypothetical protein
MEVPSWDAKSLGEAYRTANAKAIADAEEKQKQQVAIAYDIIKHNMLRNSVCQVDAQFGKWYLSKGRNEVPRAALTTPQWRQIQTVLREKGFVVVRVEKGYAIQFPLPEEPSPDQEDDP